MAACTMEQAAWSSVAYVLRCVSCEPCSATLFHPERRRGMRTHLQACIGGSDSREAKQRSHMDPQMAGISGHRDA